MKKTILILTISFIFALSSYSAIIVNNDGPYHIGVRIGFNKDCHDFGRGESNWEFGDDTVKGFADDLDHGWQYHSYSIPGTYKVTYTHGSTISTPMCGVTSAAYSETYMITILPGRLLTASPSNPGVDQLVYFSALNFNGSSLLWNFGESSSIWGSPYQTHRYSREGVYTVSVMEKDIRHTPVTTVVTVLPDNRFIQVSNSEIRTGQPIIIYARNFYGETILWNFGDGTIILGGQTVSHIYKRPGNYTITAIDDEGTSKKKFETKIHAFGISDTVLLEIAELSFANGKYFMVVPRKSDILKPILRLKMRGTGVVTGYWLYDGAVFGFINELSTQGAVKEITMDKTHPLPTIDPGVHTITFHLTNPETEAVFPILRYYVLPYERGFTLLSPPDGFVAKDKEIPEFSWEQIKGGAAKYQIAFEKSLYNLMDNKSSVKWTDVKGSLNFTPDKIIWNGLKRNRWTYWKVRAFDSFNNVVGESGINEIKVVIAKAEITLNKITDLEGKKIHLGKDGIFSGSDMILINGSVEYKGDSKFLILQVMVNDKMIDQLLFRDVKKNEIRTFETSVPGKKKGKIVFRVLKSSSPSVVVGIKGILLK